MSRAPALTPYGNLNHLATNRQGDEEGTSFSDALWPLPQGYGSSVSPQSPGVARVGKSILRQQLGSLSEAIQGLATGDVAVASQIDPPSSTLGDAVVQRHFHHEFASIFGGGKVSPKAAAHSPPWSPEPEVVAASLSQHVNGPARGAESMSFGGGWGLDECFTCRKLKEQVSAAAQALSGFAGAAFNWSAGMRTSERRELAELALDYLQPCSLLHADLRQICTDLEHILAKELKYDSPRNKKGAEASQRGERRNRAGIADGSDGQPQRPTSPAIITERLEALAPHLVPRRNPGIGVLQTRKRLLDLTTRCNRRLSLTTYMGAWHIFCAKRRAARHVDQELEKQDCLRLGLAALRMNSELVRKDAEAEAAQWFQWQSEQQMRAARETALKAMMRDALAGNPKVLLQTSIRAWHVAAAREAGSAAREMQKALAKQDVMRHGHLLNSKAAGRKAIQRWFRGIAHEEMRKSFYAWRGAWHDERRNIAQRKVEEVKHEVEKQARIEGIMAMALKQDSGGADGLLLRAVMLAWHSMARLRQVKRSLDWTIDKQGDRLRMLANRGFARLKRWLESVALRPSFSTWAHTMYMEKMRRIRETKKGLYEMQRQETDTKVSRQRVEALRVIGRLTLETSRSSVQLVIRLWYFLSEEGRARKFEYRAQVSRDIAREGVRTLFGITLRDAFTQWRFFAERRVMPDDPTESGKADYERRPSMLNSDRREVETSPAVPQALYVEAALLDKLQGPMAKVSGLYVVAPRRTPNLFPAWKQLDGNHWLYSGTNGHWIIGDSHEEAQNFLCETGVVGTFWEHRGAMPHEIGSGSECWLVFRKGQWVEDEYVSIALAA
eukprot:TRINITY_DN15247_c0_g1_i1.p1 TRINITY_DN15247_c0_g1~~TRINITY_DN15247_c0_g1_i1.p1  ORF type:complete len:838 (-),score=184.29 TRINITY_DN15247_c0_g1_i1:692-3205(-)